MVLLLPRYADWLLSTCPVVQLNLRIVTARSGEESIICEHVPLALFTHIHFVCVLPEELPVVECACSPIW